MWRAPSAVPRLDPPGVGCVTRKNVMKFVVPALFIASTLIPTAAIGPAFANADDDAWIAKCVGDNADQGQSAKPSRFIAPA